MMENTSDAGEEKEMMKNTSDASEEKEKMMENTSDASEENVKPDSLLNVVLSWPMEDVLNENLYKDKVSFYPLYSILTLTICIILLSFTCI